MDAGVRNIDELRQFGRNLSMASGNLMSLFQQLTLQMHQVCDSWHDDKNRSFMAEFEQKHSEIEKIAQQMQHYSQFINRVCDAAEQYKSLNI